MPLHARPLLTLPLAAALALPGSAAPPCPAHPALQLALQPALAGLAHAMLRLEPPPQLADLNVLAVTHAFAADVVVAWWQGACMAHVDKQSCLAEQSTAHAWQHHSMGNPI